MINFSICEKCQYCEIFSRGRTEKRTGELLVRPHVECGAEGDSEYLMLDDSPPSVCRFKMEHTLSTQTITRAVANNLSGPKIGDFS